MMYNKGFIIATVMTLICAADMVQSRRLVLTNVDDGKTVPVSIGDDIEVRLEGYGMQGLSYTWSIPASDATSGLRRVSGAVTPTGGAMAVFHDEGPDSSSSIITSTRTCRPDPGRECPSTLLPWTVTVTSV